MNIIYRKSINTLVRSALRPFSRILPDKWKFPINGTITVKSKTVPAFFLNTNPTNWMSRRVFWDKIEGFEYNSVRIFCELITNCSVFLDIGANIGYYSLLASSLTHGKVKVYAFVPMQSAFDFLQKNIVYFVFKKFSSSLRDKNN